MEDCVPITQGLYIPYTFGRASRMIGKILWGWDCYRAFFLEQKKNTWSDVAILRPMSWLTSGRKVDNIVTSWATMSTATVADLRY